MFHLSCLCLRASYRNSVAPSGIVCLYPHKITLAAVTVHDVGLPLTDSGAAPRLFLDISKRDLALVFLALGETCSCFIYSELSKTVGMKYVDSVLPRCTMSFWKKNDQ